MGKSRDTYAVIGQSRSKFHNTDNKGLSSNKNIHKYRAKLLQIFYQCCEGPIIIDNYHDMSSQFKTCVNKHSMIVINYNYMCLYLYEKPIWHTF